MGDWTKKKQNRLKKLLEVNLAYRKISEALSDEFNERITKDAVRHAAYRYFPELAETKIQNNNKNKKWKGKLLSELERLVNEGYSQREIAKVLSNEFNEEISVQAVKSAVRDYRDKMDLIEKEELWTKDRIETFKQLYMDGLSHRNIVEEIMNEHDIVLSVDQIRRARDKFIDCEDIKEVEKNKIGSNGKDLEDYDELTDEEIEGEIERDKELMRLKMQKKEMEKKYRLAIKDQILQERVVQTVKENIIALPKVPVPRKVKIIKKARKKETAVLLVSDNHIGEVVSFEETGGINEYNFSVFRHRLQFLCEATIDIIKDKLSGYDIEDLQVFLLGDHISGEIHQELKDSAPDTVMEWVSGGALVFAQFFQELAQEFKNIVVPCIYGNHGRMTKKPTAKRRYVNWDTVFFNQVSLLLKNQPNIEFIIPKSFYYLHKIYDWNILLMHGDYGINGGFAGLPFYGIQRSSYRLNDLLNSPENGLIDYIILAHFHSLTNLDQTRGGCTIINGSMIGSTEYSIGKMFLANHPKQLLMSFHPEKGKTFQFDINLNFALTDSEIRYKYDENDTLVGQAKGMDF